ncbi:MAG: ABC transporter permease [Planctomycetaceae bacterium]|nr:ABC transporter permease [Planctomycetaceae bacterium]
MIWLIVRISALRLWHNKAELVLTFVVPLVFFSIFALIFGSRERSGETATIKVAVSDMIKNADSQKIIEELQANGTLRFVDADSQVLKDGELKLLDPKVCERLVREGGASVAIVLEGSKKEKESQESALSAKLLTDSSDQVAPKIVSALVQQLLVQKSVAALAKNAQPVPPPNSPALPASAIPADSSAKSPIAFTLPEVKTIDLVGGQKKNPIIAMYASGIAVMFLLFSVVGGGGALLEEKENSTLERLLASQLTLDELLMGKWLYLMLLGTLQTTLMFVWGEVVFGVELSKHWEGFLMMTLVTSAAASSLSLFLATMCNSRAQLNWVSVVLVLGMSALGGSMVPRYLMSERIREVGLLTFNAWALDGYNKIFWRNLPLQSLWPQLAVLLMIGLIFMIAARIGARRWERV